MLSRRSFLAQLLIGSAGAVAPASWWSAAKGRSRLAAAHPTPRPGITGANVLTADKLTRSSHVIPIFDGIRAIPQIADGIRCHCGCAGLPGFYSLLSCFEDDGMAKVCPICQGEGRVAIRMQKEGKSLDEIRAAIDAQFG